MLLFDRLIGKHIQAVQTSYCKALLKMMKNLFICRVSRIKSIMQHLKFKMVDDDLIYMLCPKEKKKEKTFKSFFLNIQSVLITALGPDLWTINSPLNSKLSLKNFVYLFFPWMIFSWIHIYKVIHYTPPINFIPRLPFSFQIFI